VIGLPTRMAHQINQPRLAQERYRQLNKMENINYFLICILLISLPFRSNGQSRSEYEKEEIKVVNHFLGSLINIERLNSIKDSDSSFILFLNRELICDLDKNSLFENEYKPNRLLINLYHNGLGQRIIDSLEIKKLKNVKIYFNYNREYNLDEYNHHKVIGEITISRISFNKSLTLGYFYYQIYCGEDCGWGALVRIDKKKGIWKTTKYLEGYTL
jgi:hypothetical protein